MTRTGFAAALISVAALGADPGSAAAQVSTAELRAVLDEFRSGYGFPGATAAIALPDGQIVSTATGLADIEAGTPMTTDTRMLAASIGKTFVGATGARARRASCARHTDR